MNQMDLTYTIDIVVNAIRISDGMFIPLCYWLATGALDRLRWRPNNVCHRYRVCSLCCHCLDYPQHTLHASDLQQNFRLMLNQCAKNFFANSNLSLTIICDTCVLKSIFILKKKVQIKWIWENNCLAPILPCPISQRDKIFAWNTSNVNCFISVEMVFE